MTCPACKEKKITNCDVCRMPILVNGHISSSDHAEKMSYAKDVAEHEFLERMIPTIIAQLRLMLWDEPYAHPDYINHCNKMREIRERIVYSEHSRSFSPED